MIRISECKGLVFIFDLDHHVLNSTHLEYTAWLQDVSGWHSIFHEIFNHYIGCLSRLNFFANYPLNLELWVCF